MAGILALMVGSAIVFFVVMRADLAAEPAAVPASEELPAMEPEYRRAA